MGVEGLVPSKDPSETLGGDFVLMVIASLVEGVRSRLDLWACCCAAAHSDVEVLMGRVRSGGNEC